MDAGLRGELLFGGHFEESAGQDAVAEVNRQAEELVDPHRPRQLEDQRQGGPVQID